MCVVSPRLTYYLWRFRLVDGLPAASKKLYQLDAQATTQYSYEAGFPLGEMVLVAVLIL